MPLTLEHWPAHLRGTASGLMQSGYSMGFLLSSLVFEFGYPAASTTARLGVARDAVDRRPAGVPRALHHARRAGEPGVARAAAPSERPTAARSAVARAPLQADVLPTTLHTSIADGRVPVHVSLDHVLVPDASSRQMHLPTLPFLAALNVGGITGAIVFGRLSEGRARPSRLRHDRDARRHPGDAALPVHDETSCCCGSARWRWDSSAPATSGSCPAI